MRVVTLPLLWRLTLLGSLPACSGVQNFTPTHTVDPDGAGDGGNPASPSPTSPQSAPATGVDSGTSLTETGSQPIPINGLNLLNCGPVQPPTYGCGIVNSTTKAPITAAVSNEVVTITLTDNSTGTPALTPAPANQPYLVYLQIPATELPNISSVSMAAVIAGQGAVTLPLAQPKTALVTPTFGSAVTSSAATGTTAAAAQPAPIAGASPPAPAPAPAPAPVVNTAPIANGGC